MEMTIKTSVVDYMSAVNGGVPILMCFNIDEYSFEGVYWIHRNGNRALVIEDRFLRLFGVGDTDDLPFLGELHTEIDAVIGDWEEIFKSCLDE
jgi:hypothetical protein